MYLKRQKPKVISFSDVQYIDSNTVEQTVLKILELVNNPAELLVARQLAERILLYTPDKSPVEDFKSIMDYVRSHARYTLDIDGIETLKTFSKMLDEIDLQGFFYGDCDDVTIFLATLIKSIGYRQKIVIVSLASNPDNDFNHIFLQVFDPVKSIWNNYDGVLRNKAWNAGLKYRKIKFYEV